MKEKDKFDWETFEKQAIQRLLKGDFSTPAPTRSARCACLEFGVIPLSLSPSLTHSISFALIRFKSADLCVFHDMVTF